MTSVERFALDKRFVNCLSSCYGHDVIHSCSTWGFVQVEAVGLSDLTKDLA